MKTLQIGDDWIGDQVGGLGRYYSELLRSLPGTGVCVDGLVVGSARAAMDTDGQVNAFAAPEQSIVQRLLSLRRASLKLMATRRLDLIASHFALYALPVLDQVRKTPLVVHFHGPWAGESGAEGAAGLNTRLKRLVEQQVYSRAARFIVLSESFRQELATTYKVPEDRVRCIPGGVNTERFNTLLSRPQARTQLGWPTDRPIVLTVRRQVRRMGLEALIEASKLVVAQSPEVLFLIGGTGPLAAGLQRQIAEHGLERNVRLLGRISDDDLPVAYRAADLSVVPSQAFEGFGLITLESLASGTPALVTPIGGLPEVIRPFAPECIFAGTTAQDIASLLIEVLRGTSPKPTDASCRDYATTNFAWPTIASRVRAAYQEVLA